MANLPALTPTNFAEALTFAEELSKSTMVPPAFQRNPANILVAIQWGAELGLGPLQALQNIAVINGKPSVYGDAMLALVRGSPVCEDIIERIDRQDDNRIAVCEARRKGAAPVFGRFSINDAKRAGLWDKPGPWKQYPLRMLQMRARGFALRDAFPDVLRGVISVEEAGDYPRQIRDVTLQGDTLATDLDAFAATTSTEVSGHSRDDAHGSLAEPPRRPRDEAVISPAGPEDALEEGVRRQQSRIAQVLGPEEIASLDKEALPEAITLIRPQRLRRGGWDWPAYAEVVITTALQLPPEQMPEFRVAQKAMLDALQTSNKELWSRVQQTLATHEQSSHGAGAHERSEEAG
jgi:hypothetical protein